MQYKNPVYPGYFADPFVLRLGRDYYAYGTGGEEAHGEPEKRVFTVLHSTDLAHWERVGAALKSLNDPAKPAYWAPEVAEQDGMFFMYYSAGGPEGEGHKLRVAVSDRPEGPFEDVGRELMPNEPFSIDASPFRDPADGRWYLFFAKDFFDGRAGTGTAVVRLAGDMVHVDGEPVTVMRAQWDWQIYQRNRFWYGRTWDAWHTVEGPSVVFHDGRYYCFYSGGCWQTAQYGVGFCVADHVMGPYVDSADADGPSVLHEVPGKVLGPGHNSTALAPNDITLYCVYHAWDANRTARRMCIDPIAWTPDGPRCLGPTWEEQRG